MKRTESPPSILWVLGGEPTPSLPDTPPSLTSQQRTWDRPVLACKVGAGLGARRAGAPLPAPFPSKKWQFLESVNLFPAVVAKKGKKEKTLLGFKETHNNFRKPREMEVLVSLNIQQRPEAPRLSHAVWSLGEWAGQARPGTPSGSGVVPPLATGNARLPERQPLFS